MTPPLVDLVTTSRADLSLIEPIARELSRREDTRARLVVTGSRVGGGEVRVDDVTGDAPLSIVEVPVGGMGSSVRASGSALASMTEGFAALWSDAPPDLVVLLGDRFELFAPLSIATLYRLPVAHLFGGEEDVSYCFDTLVRNAVTKASHLHLVGHEAQRQRLLAMGEEPWRVHVCGNPSIASVDIDADRQSEAFDAWARGAGIGEGPIIAACHLPTTALPGAWRDELDAIEAALDSLRDVWVIWTGVNADPEAIEIRAALLERIANRPRERFVEGLGRERYFGLLRRSRAMLGNSSSGLLEAASFGLPVINVGARQTGRLAGSNVNNVPADAARILAAIEEACVALRPEAKNPYHRPDTLMRIGDLLSLAARVDRLGFMLKRTPETVLPTGGLSRVPEYPPHAQLSVERFFLAS